MQLHRFWRGSFFIGMVLSVCLAAAAVHAGQVVTEDMRHWARDAAARESALDARTAPNTVGILYFDNLTGHSDLDALQKGLTVMLITDLSKIETIQVVERTRLQALLDELDLGVTGLMDSATAPRMGRLLGAAYLVGGRMLPEGADPAIRIDSDLLRVSTQDTVGHPSSAGPFEDLLRMQKEIAFEIVHLLGVELSPAQIEDLRRPLTNNIRALMFWFHGIEMSDRGDFQGAAASYRRAMRTDPGFRPAADAFNELRTLRLVAPPADTSEVLQNLRRRVSVNDGPEPDEIFKRDTPGPIGGTSDVIIRWRDLDQIIGE